MFKLRSPEAQCRVLNCLYVHVIEYVLKIAFGLNMMGMDKYLFYSRENQKAYYRDTVLTFLSQKRNLEIPTDNVSVPHAMWD